MILYIDQIENDAVLVISENEQSFIVPKKDFDLLIQEGDVVNISFHVDSVNSTESKNTVSKIKQQLLDSNKEGNKENIKL